MKITKLRTVEIQEKEMITPELGMLRTYDADKDGKLRIMPK
ncbi:MAG: hypothetical protein ABSF81_05705 [Bacteroidales bacterium]